MIETVIIAGVVGLAAGVLIAKLYIDSVSKERHTDAYEEGWSHGYDIGLKAPRPKRVKTIRKADA